MLRCQCLDPCPGPFQFAAVMYTAVYVLWSFSRRVLLWTPKDLQNAAPFYDGPMINKRTHRKVILPWLAMEKQSRLLSCLRQLVPVPAQGRAPSIPFSAGWQVSAWHHNWSPCFSSSASQSPFLSFGAPVAPSPLQGFPGCCAAGAVRQQCVEGWGAAVLHSPVTPPAGPSTDWWTGQADTEKDAWYTRDVAWELHFTQALL